MDKRFWGIIAVIAVIFVGIVWANGRSADAPENSTGQASSHTKGENAKKVTFIEYGDFQCPVCNLYEPTVTQVVEKYKADISFQYRHFPLQQIHQNAFAAARAAEAASLQGKFWEMHDILYQNQNAWSTSNNPLAIYEQYAKTLGINTAQFKTDFASDKVNDTVNADIREGNKLNVSGTPAFFIDGVAVPTTELVGDDKAPSVDKFSQKIDAAIAKKNP